VDVLGAGLDADAGVDLDLCDLAGGRPAVLEDGLGLDDGLVQNLALLRDAEAVPEGLVGLPGVADFLHDPLSQRTQGVEVILGVVDDGRTHPALCFFLLCSRFAGFREFVDDLRAKRSVAQISQMRFL